MVLIFIMSGLVLIQGIFVAAIFFITSQKMAQVEKQLVRLSGLVFDNMNYAHQGMDYLRKLDEFLPMAQKKVDGILKSLSQGARATSDSLEKGVVVARDKVDEANRRIDYGLSMVTRRTSRARRGIHDPIVHLSAIMHGVAVGFRALRQRRRPVPQQEFYEEEGFI